MDVRFTTDPAEFLAETGPLLAADPVIASVVATTTERAARERAEGMPPPQRPCWWATVREGGEIVGVAMRTAPNPPYPLFLMPMPDQAARALATALHDRDEHPGGCNGALEAIRAFADETVRRWGGTAEAAQHTRLFECRDVIRPRAVPGLLRPAGIEDLELVVEWHEAFHLDAAEQADRDPQTEIKPDQDTLRRHTTAGKYWLFVDQDGTRAHLTGVSEPAFGVSRIGPVYTPKPHRGRGIAAHVVAELTARGLAAGHRMCLFTDQANPVSNKIYEAVGYRQVVDMANLRVSPRP